MKWTTAIEKKKKVELVVLYKKPNQDLIDEEML